MQHMRQSKKQRTDGHEDPEQNFNYVDFHEQVQMMQKNYADQQSMMMQQQFYMQNQFHMQQPMMTKADDLDLEKEFEAIENKVTEPITSLGDKLHNMQGMMMGRNQMGPHETNNS